MADIFFGDLDNIQVSAIGFTAPHFVAEHYHEYSQYYGDLTITSDGDIKAPLTQSPSSSPIPSSSPTPPLPPSKVFASARDYVPPPIEYISDEIINTPKVGLYSKFPKSGSSSLPFFPSSGIMPLDCIANNDLRNNVGTHMERNRNDFSFSSRQLLSGLSLNDNSNSYSSPQLMDFQQPQSNHFYKSSQKLYQDKNPLPVNKETTTRIGRNTHKDTTTFYDDEYDHPQNDEYTNHTWAGNLNTYDTLRNNN